MPFTLAHPAAAVPFRRWLGTGTVSALVAGSVSPDLPYFLPLGVLGRQSHSLAGVVWFCVPAGLAAWMLYVALIRPLVLVLLPPSFSCRMLERSWPDGPPGARALRLVAAVLVGALTHLAWDSFTHAWGAGVALLPLLRTRVVGPHGVPLFKLLQHASTLVGAFVLVAWGRRWRARTSPLRAVDDAARPARLRVATLVVWTIPAAVTGLAVAGARLQGSSYGYRTVQVALGRGLTATGTVFLAVVLATAMGWRAYRRR